MLVKQPTAKPTRKLSAASITGVVISASGLVVRNLWPEWFDAGLWLAATPVISFCVGYVMHESAPDAPDGMSAIQDAA